jgi:hypothetical protein
MSDVRLVVFWISVGCYKGTCLDIEVGTMSDVRLVGSGCSSAAILDVRLVLV